MFINIKFKIHIFNKPTYQFKYINQYIRLNNFLIVPAKMPISTDMGKFRPVQSKQADTTRYFFQYILEQYRYWFNDQYSIFSQYDINFLDLKSIVEVEVARFAWVCWFHCFSLGLSLLNSIIEVEAEMGLLFHCRSLGLLGFIDFIVPLWVCLWVC